jgi:hypothetical protein
LSKDDFHQKLKSTYEITFTVKGRKSGKDNPRPVWFAYDDNTLYLLPVQGSDTNWYKNLLFDPMVKISINGIEILARGQTITDSNGVDEIVKSSNLNMRTGYQKILYKI